MPFPYDTNLESWQFVVDDIEEHPDDYYWTPWKHLARCFLAECFRVGLQHYFRAGQAMHDLVFSTLDYHRILSEPHVVIQLQPPSELRVIYRSKEYSPLSRRLEYQLTFEEGFATFRRFLNHLWTATKDEPIPAELRGPLAPFSAPILAAKQTAQSSLRY